jgi:hypothetical protein
MGAIKRLRDDTLITERNVVAFLRTTEILAEDEVAGFLRSGEDVEGRRRGR